MGPNPNPGNISTPILTRLSDVQPESVSWLWPKRIARGKLTLIIGDPGLGKSNVTLDIAARMTAGKAWPDAPAGPVGNVILLSAEDGVGDTIRPRVDGLGGDATRIFVLQAVKSENKQRPFNLARDLPALAEAIKRTNAQLVIIDPLTAYLGGTADTHRDADVREVLSPLVALAQQTSVAIVAVMHLNKDAQKAAIYRSQGSIAFVGTARAVFIVAQDPDDKDRRFFAPVKMNIGALPPTLAFHLPDGVVSWESDSVDVDLAAVLGGLGLEDPVDAGDSSECAAAEQFLRELLRNGPVESKEVLRTAKEQGISTRTLQRAKARLGVESKRLGGLAGAGLWVWCVPGSSPKDATASADEPKSATKDASPRDEANLAEPEAKQRRSSSNATKIPDPPKSRGETVEELNVDDVLNRRVDEAKWDRIGRVIQAEDRRRWRRRR